MYTPVDDVHFNIQSMEDSAAHLWMMDSGLWLCRYAMPRAQSSASCTERLRLGNSLDLQGNSSLLMSFDVL